MVEAAFLAKRAAGSVMGKDMVLLETLRVWLDWKVDMTKVTVARSTGSGVDSRLCLSISNPTFSEFTLVA